MKRSMKHLLLAIAVVLCCMSCCAFAEAQGTLRYAKGDQIQDFTFTTYEGQVITLSDVLKEKDAVLINIWATWCGPCRNEFPFLQEAYQQYQDRVEVIALSCEATDTASVLADFAAKYGLTFKIGQDPVDFLSAFGVGSIPTSFIVDRYGTICFVASGSMPDVGSFTRLFDAFLGEDYVDSVVYDSIPPAKPDVAPSSEEDITTALEAAGTNPAGAYTWPMTVAEVDGRYVVASTNQGIGATTASITATVEAKAGDAIVVTYKTSTEPVFDLMRIAVNNDVVKVFGGEHDWMTYAISVEETAMHTVTISYVKNSTTNGGSDTIWVDRIQVVSGEAAAAALADNPEYPTSEAVSISMNTPSAREIQITDPYGLLPANFGDAKYYITNSDTARFTATLTDAHDPESAFFYCNYDGSITPAVLAVTADGYEVHGGVDSLETTGYSFTCMYLYPDEYGADAQCIVYFRDDTDADQFVSVNRLGSWSYAETAPADDLSGRDDLTPAAAEYSFICIDQHGAPVVGVMLQVCDEETCQVVVTDEQGRYQLVAAPYAWEVHILKAPAGYTADSTEILIAPADGGELVFTLHKE